MLRTTQPATKLFALLHFSALCLSACGGGGDSGGGGTVDGTVYSISGNGPALLNAVTAQAKQSAGVDGANMITVSASDRTAGAISSIRWRDKEFVNNYDHGRQAQYAWQYGLNGECANPTEAGSSSDGTGNKTSSFLKMISTEGNVLRTVTQPASWLNCGPSIANDLIEKTVSIENGIITMKAQLTARSIPQPIRIEAPTVYLSSEFEYFYTLEGIADHSTCIVSDENNPYWQNMQGCDITEPIIAATADGSYAIGLYTVPTDEPITYAFYHLTKINDQSPAEARSRKISVYIQRQDGSISKEITSYLAIGNLAAVREAIANLSDR